MKNNYLFFHLVVWNVVVAAELVFHILCAPYYFLMVYCSQDLVYALLNLPFLYSFALYHSYSQ